MTAPHEVAARMRKHPCTKYIAGDGWGQRIRVASPFFAELAEGEQ